MFGISVAAASTSASFIETENELFYHLALSLVPGVGPVAGKSLISYCGSATAVFHENKRRISKIPGIGSSIANALFCFKDFHRAENELKFIKQNRLIALHYTSKEYPIRLKQVIDSPLVLYVKGDTDLNQKKIVAIVGTRKNTHYGSEITRRIIEDLKPYNVAVISGMAYGIDITAHKACLENNLPTIGVLGHGLDMLYPAQHKKYALQMLEQEGALITEFTSQTPLNKDLFPRRNRIVAGMCDCVLVVESMVKGGSMLTADIASSYNKDVFAVPGRVTDIMREGCNYLIKTLKAAPCENAEDLANGMNWSKVDEIKPKKVIQTEMFHTLNGDEQKIVYTLTEGEKNYDDIFFHTQIPIHKLNPILLDLEMKGLLQSLPGKMYGVLR